MITKNFFNRLSEDFPQTPQYFLLNGYRLEEKNFVESMSCQAIQRERASHQITEIVTLIEVRFYVTKNKTTCCVWLTYPNNHHAIAGSRIVNEWERDFPQTYQIAIESLGVKFLAPVYDQADIKDSMLQLAYLLAQLDQKHTYSHYTIQHAHA